MNFFRDMVRGCQGDELQQHGQSKWRLRGAGKEGSFDVAFMFKQMPGFPLGGMVRFYLSDISGVAVKCKPLS